MVYLLYIIIRVYSIQLWCFQKLLTENNKMKHDIIIITYLLVISLWI